jgi:hypothetical protein
MAENRTFLLCVDTNCRSPETGILYAVVNRVDCEQRVVSNSRLPPSNLSA